MSISGGISDLFRRFSALRERYANLCFLELQEVRTVLAFTSPMSIGRYIIFSLIAVYSGLVFAKKTICYSALTHNEFEEGFPKDKILSDSVRADLRTFILNSKLSEEETWRQVLNKYVDLRLEYFPDTDQEKLRLIIYDFIEKKIKFTEDISKFQASIEGMILPTTFRNSPLWVAIAAHEIEHLIHYFQQNGRLRKIIQAIRDSLNDPFHLYLIESEAMMAEWEIYSLISEQERVSVSSLIESTSIKRKYKTVLLRGLVNSQLSRADYVREEHRSWRYSVGQVTAIAVNQLAFKIGFTSALGLSAYTIIATLCGFPQLPFAK